MRAQLAAQVAPQAPSAHQEEQPTGWQQPEAYAQLAAQVVHQEEQPTGWQQPAAYAQLAARVAHQDEQPASWHQPAPYAQLAAQVHGFAHQEEQPASWQQPAAYAQLAAQVHGFAHQDEQPASWQQTAAWPHAPTTYAQEVLPQRPVACTQLAAPSAHQDDQQAVTEQPRVHAQLEVQSDVARHQYDQVLMYAPQHPPASQDAMLAQRAQSEVLDSSQDAAEESPSQTSTAPTDDGPLPPTPSALPTPVGSPVSLGSNPQEAPAAAATIPPWHKHRDDAERPPPLKRPKPNGVFEVWHPYKDSFFSSRRPPG